MKDLYIAGHRSAADWQTIRTHLLDRNADSWYEAFTDFYEARLNLRYLHPIKVLQENGTFQGEGFAIAAIQCSLIEFLESTEQGLSYRFIRNKESLGPYEYNSSQDIFVSFLKNRNPFSQTFNQTTAEDFYVGVRCGLLHEARTKNGWRIWAQDSSGFVANTTERIVYRDNFQKALLAYITNYHERLLITQELQLAFIRKFDTICDLTQ